MMMTLKRARRISGSTSLTSTLPISDPGAPGAGWGRSTERCVWGHTLLDEYAGALGVDCATAAADLSKFYEHIGHQLLVDEAAAWGALYGCSC